MRLTPVLDHRLENVPVAALDALQLRSGATSRVDSHPPVVALTLTSGTGVNRRVLVCVRDPRTNRTHPGVLSAPTKRVTEPVDMAALVDGQGRWTGAVPGWLVRGCERLLVEKLDQAWAMTPRRIDAVAVWQGDSVIGTASGSVVTESLTMINAHLDMTGLEHLFPARTDSYRDIGWISAADHRQMTAMRNAEVIGLNFNGRVPIVYGLCTQSTAAMLLATETSGNAGHLPAPALA